jgi:hypothetical protein
MVGREAGKQTLCPASFFHYFNIYLHGYTLFWPPPLPPSLFCDAGDGTQGHLYVTVLPWSYIPSLLLFWFEPKSSQGLSTGLKLYFEETCIGCYSPHLQPV